MHLKSFLPGNNAGVTYILQNMATMNVHEIIFPTLCTSYESSLCCGTVSMIWNVWRSLPDHYAAYCIMCKYLFSSINVFIEELISAITMLLLLS
jgi:hypothetical protein